jgi:hypothetical protein
MANTTTPLKSTQTAFKVIIYWIYEKGTNRKYTPDEIKQKLNRRYLPSHDYTSIKGVNVCDHNLALQKLDICLGLKYKGKFYTAFVIFNSQFGEIVVRKYLETGLSEQRNVSFMPYGKELRDIHVSKITGNPILINQYDPAAINFYDVIDSNTMQEFGKKQLYNTYQNIKADAKEINRPNGGVNKLRERFGTMK